MWYRKFNLGALLDVAVKAKGDTERSCIEIVKINVPSFSTKVLIAGVKLLKCVEGQFNKAFILTMDDGDEVVARLPNPNAGPPFYTLASEVATLEFVRRVTTVYWSS